MTPTYYVLFTFATLVTSIILFQGLDSTPIQIVTIVLGFLTICAGITLLQLSKIDPEDLSEKDGVDLDRNTTLLIRASRSQISQQEKGRSTGLEDPGVDSVRGGLGVIGSIVRARSSRNMRAHASSDEYHRMANEHGGMLCTLGKGDMERYELQDRPMPPTSPTMGLAPGGLFLSSLTGGMPQKRDTAISFASGSEQPHGHRAAGPGNRGNSGTSATSPNENPQHGGILMSPTISGPGATLHAEPASYTNTRGQPRAPPLTQTSSYRPSGPRLPRSDAADNIASMWTEDDFNNGDLASTLQSGAPTPNIEQEDDDDFAASKDNLDDTLSSTDSSSPIKSKRSGGIFGSLRSPTQSQFQSRRGMKDDGLDEELLSPIMRNDLESADGSFRSSDRRRSRG